MLIHTPRTIHAIGKGFARQRKVSAETAHVGGVGPNNPYVSYNRAGIFDCDYQLHLNNAAYLIHAEYARWELCAYNGLMASMYKDNIHFVVGNTAVRFRREIRPVFRAFQIHSHVARLDSRNFWLMHAFRYAPGGQDPGRIRAQVICQGLAVQNRKVIDPRIYLKETVGMDPDIIDSISVNDDDDRNDNPQTTMDELLNQYSDMETTLKELASQDDEELLQVVDQDKKKEE